MQAQELRIGNYIKWIDNVVKVDLEIMKLVSENPDWAKHIEITDEILLGCGLKKDDYDDDIFLIELVDCNRFECYKNYEGNYFVANTPYHLFAKLNGVHELQNAYYLATKEELEINLETL